MIMPSATTLTFTLVITGAPYSSQAPQTALSFAQAVVASGHVIDRVFLYGDGIHLASSLTCPPSDETNWTQAWVDFLTTNQITAVACIASALRRGLLNASEQKRYEKPAANLSAPFEIAGLGDWVDGVTQSSRTLYFHGEN